MAFRCEYRRGRLVAAGLVSLALGAVAVTYGHGKGFIAGCVLMLVGPAFLLFAAMLKNAVEATASRLVIKTMWGREHRIQWNAISRIEHKLQRVGVGAYQTDQDFVEIDYLLADGGHETARLTPQFIKLPGGVDGLLSRLEEMVNGRALDDLPRRGAQAPSSQSAPPPAIPGPRRGTFGRKVA